MGISRFLVGHLITSPIQLILQKGLLVIKSYANLFTKIKIKIETYFDSFKAHPPNGFFGSIYPPTASKSIALPNLQIRALYFKLAWISNI